MPLSPPDGLPQVQLRTFERAFEAREGRVPTKADLTPRECQMYQRYKQLKLAELETATLQNTPWLASY